MNFFAKFGCRAFQKSFYLASFLLPFREPSVIDGSASLSEKLPGELKKRGFVNPFIVIDPFLHGKEADRISEFLLPETPDPFDLARRHTRGF